jgi:2-hydroxychromene-2-carboxylate isomerase
MKDESSAVAPLISSSFILHPSFPTHMKHLTFFFDPISPFAYLAFERLPEALEGCSYVVDYQPVLFAGLLKHWGQKGPAEIEPKREWTFRQVAWLAEQQGTPLVMPAMHPFNPLALLRLLIAAGPNRRSVQAVMRHVWAEGGDPNDPQRLAALTASLNPQADSAGADVKAELRAATDAAIAQGVFGVPTVMCDGRIYWGQDALPMLRGALCAAS